MCPKQVAETAKDLRIKDVACGEAHCLALDMEGQIFAWGFDEFSQAGGKAAADEVLVQSPLASPRGPDHKAIKPSAACKVVPKPHRLPTASVSFVGIACGAQFSLALDTAGGVWCWGNGEGGVLGLGTHSLSCRRQLTRVPISSEGDAGSEECCKFVACGSYHSMAVSRAGGLYTWGRTEGGQLGIAEEQIASHIEALGLVDTCVCTPMCVAFPSEKDGLKVVQAAGGDVHTLALDAEGRAWSWGWGEFGQLGLGFSSSSFQVGHGGASSRRPTPQLLPAQHLGGKVLLVACGGAFSAALVGTDLAEGGRLVMLGCC